MKKFIAMILSLILVLGVVPGIAEEEHGLSSFTATDMDGNEVTQDIFKDYQLTMVNVWATWCGVCLHEMPEFKNLKDQLPENVNLITICDDASTDVELTAQILSDGGANFTTLIGNQELYDELLSTVEAFPTTFFVDSEGHVITDPLVGVPDIEDIPGGYLSIINQILPQMEA